MQDLTHQITIGNENRNDLASPTQHQQASTDYDGAAYHDGSPPAPLGCTPVSQDADNGLHDQSRERSSNPHERKLTFCQSELEEIWGAIGHFDSPCEPA